MSADIIEDVRMRLDVFARGEGTAETLGPALSALCSAAPESAWEILALLDQYHRRGMLPADLFRALKTRVNRIALMIGDRNATREVPVRAENPQATRELTPSSPSAREAHTRELERPSLQDDAVEPLLPPAMDRTPISATPGPTADAAPTPRAPSAPAPARAPSPGRILKDRYVIEGVLGRGGMSTVFRALDRQRADLPERNRFVAVKILNADLAHRPEAVAAFRNEFYSVQRLSHPNIVNVFDLDSDGSTHYFTMELLEGELLSRLMERIQPRALSKPHALAIVREVGLALICAHDRGIAHADLKPHNIMVTRDGEIRVLDFGAGGQLAVRGPWISDDKLRTFRSATPAYASCERLEGAAPDIHDDIFSLSCMAYELLTGTHPFQRQSAIEAREARLKPARIAGLTQQQWRTLSAGLSWQREDRAASVREWLAGLDLQQSTQRLPPLDDLEAPPPRRGIPVRAALLGLLAVSVAVAGYLNRDELSTLSATAGAVLESASGTVARLTEPVPDRPSAQTEVSAAIPAETEGEGVSASPEPAAATAADTSAVVPALVTAPEQPAPQPAVESAAPPDATEDATQQTLIAAVEPRRVATPGRISFAQETYVVSPSDSAARITLRRSGGSAGEVGFSWWTEEGTAREEEDFISLGRKTETLGNGERQLAVFVPIVSDTLRGNSEVFYVSLGEPEGGMTLGEITRATVIIARGEE